MSNKISLVGQRFGKLVVMEDLGSIVPGDIQYRCICDCGSSKIVLAKYLRSGGTSSCGCTGIQSRSANGRLHKIADRDHVLYRNIYARVRNSTRKRNKSIIFDITIDEFISIVSSPCIYCGKSDTNSMEYSYSGERKSYTGIDRVNSDIGYILSNCVPCCKHCNWAKGDRSLDEFKKWIKLMYQHVDEY